MNYSKLGVALVLCALSSQSPVLASSRVALQAGRQCWNRAAILPRVAQNTATVRSFSTGTSRVQSQEDISAAIKYNQDKMFKEKYFPIKKEGILMQELQKDYSWAKKFAETPKYGYESTLSDRQKMNRISKDIEKLARGEYSPSMIALIKRKISMFDELIAEKPSNFFKIEREKWVQELERSKGPRQEEPVASWRDTFWNSVGGSK